MNNAGVPGTKRPVDNEKQQPSKKKSAGAASKEKDLMEWNNSWSSDSCGRPVEDCGGHIMQLDSAEAAGVSATHTEVLMQQQVANVLRAEVKSAEGDGWNIQGGTINITIAASRLTARQKEQLCEALEELELCYNRGSEFNVSGCFHDKGYLAVNSLFENFPDQVPGETMKEGTVIFFPGSKLKRPSIGMSLWQEVKPHHEKNRKVMGWIADKQEQEALSCAGCEDGEMCEDGYDGDCYCKTGLASTTLSSVRFV